MDDDSRELRSSMHMYKGNRHKTKPNPGRRKY